MTSKKINELELKLTEIKQENERLKEYIKQTTGENGQLEATRCSSNNNNSEAVKVHTFYQDLFLTNMKKEIVEAENEVHLLKEQVTRLSKLLKQVTQDKINLESVLKRYRKIISESPQVKTNTEVKEGDQLMKQRFDQSKSIDSDNVNGSLHVSLNANSMIQKHNSSMPFSVNSVDIPRLEKIESVIHGIFKAKKPFKAMINLLFDIKGCVNCNNVTFFVIKESITQLSQVKHSIYKQKILLEGKWVERIGINETELSDPCFRKVESTRHGLRTQEFMAFPILNTQSEIVAVMQVESKRKKHNNLIFGFYLLDELILRMFLQTLQVKIDQTLVMQEVSLKDQQILDTLQLASDISCCRTYRDLFRSMRSKLSVYFDYDFIGILLFDKHLDELFSIHETADSVHQKQKSIDQLAPASYVRFPHQIGVTGIAFHQHQITISNNAQREQKFLNEIDNQTNASDVHSFMIGPALDEQGNSIGVIQFINKKNQQSITQLDVIKFTAFQKLLGVSIQNTCDVHTNVNTQIAVKSSMFKMRKLSASIASNLESMEKPQLELRERIEWLKVITGKLKPGKKSSGC